MDERLKTPRLVAIGVLAFLLFNAPLVSIADSDARLLGVPVLFAYFFVTWLLVIALVALIARRSG